MRLGFVHEPISMGNQSKIDMAASIGKGERTSIDALTDDLLELVLLRAISPVCLVRAAATCRLWRRVIAGAGFLRRVRPLHQPHLLGCYYSKYHPRAETIFVSAASPPGIAGIDDRRRLSLSLDFLPHPTNSLMPTDSRGGLLAFAEDCKDGIVVCNPCTREYKEVSLPLIEGNKVPQCSCINAFLLDADTDTSPLMSRFRVLFVCAHGYGNSPSAEVYVFSARDDRWLLLSSTVAGDIVSAVNRLFKDKRNNAAYSYFLGRTGGSIFWGIPDVESNLLILDECTGEFLVSALPKPAGQMLYYRRVNLRVIGGDAPTVRFIRIVHDDLEVLTVARDGGRCVVDSRVVGLSQLANIEATMSSWTFFDVVPAAGPGCVVLSPDFMNMFFPSDNFRNMWMFSFETMMLERLSVRTWRIRVFPYERPWPPTIKACL